MAGLPAVEANDSLPSMTDIDRGVFTTVRLPISTGLTSRWKRPGGPGPALVLLRAADAPLPVLLVALRSADEQPFSDQPTRL